MGLFTKKTSSHRTSKPSLHDSVSSLESSVSSLKSPGLYNKMSSPNLLSIPKIAMPKGPDPAVDPAAYLRSIGAVRERCQLVMDKALEGQLRHFDVDMTKMDDTTRFVVSIIKVGPAHDRSR